MLVTRRSPITGKLNTLDLDITENQIQNYNNGVLLQYAFPNLTASEREFFHTGFTEEDWDLMFKE